MPFVETRTGARLHYEEHNPQAGELPVVALHGMLGTVRKDLGELIDWLAGQDLRVIGLTLRGYGESMPKPRDFPPRFYERDAEDVLAALDALGIERAHLIGYSDGGEITLICAGRAPQRFASAAAWGAVGYFGPEMRPVAQRMIPGSRWLTAEEMAPHGLTDADAFVAQWVRATIGMIDAGGDVSLSLAPQIACPLLLMLGREDTLNPAAYAQRYLERVADGRLLLFDCGHPVHTQQPEAFQRALLEHLHRASGTAKD